MSNHNIPLCPCPKRYVCEAFKDPGSQEPCPPPGTRYFHSWQPCKSSVGKLCFRPTTMVDAIVVD